MVTFSAHFFMDNDFMNLTKFLNSCKIQAPHYVVFGDPIHHSLSPLMHNTALDYYGVDATYYAVQLKTDELSSLASYLHRDTFLGANITIPYKQQLMPYLDVLDPEAERIGAVNTISKSNGKLSGHNTDIEGFLAPLEPFQWELEGQTAIVFGTGGAARAVVEGLQKIGMMEIKLISRNPDKITSFGQYDRVEIAGYSNWQAWADEAALFVNTTPLGMSPNTEVSPVRKEEIPLLRSSICYDIVYNPLETLFLRQSKKAGATTVGGLEMLIQQANRAFEIWTGKTFPLELIKKHLHERFSN